jgi:hypothetical protein
MTRAGRPVHFTTVARWQRQGLMTIARSSDTVAGMQGVRATEPAKPAAGSEDPFAELPPPEAQVQATNPPGIVNVPTIISGNPATANVVETTNGRCCLYTVATSATSVWQWDVAACFRGKRRKLGCS